MSVIFGTPNYFKSTYFTPVFGGGDWDVNNWLTNLSNKYFINKAISTDAATASTKFEVDLAVLRDIKMIGLPNSNVSAAGKIRILASSQPAWSNITVNGVNAINATTLNVQIASGNNAVIRSGDLFKIAGDTQLYQSTSQLSLGENQFTYSEDLTDSDWDTSFASVSATLFDNPFGEQTANKLIEDTSTANHQIRQDFTIANDTIVNISIFVKAAERSHFRIELRDKTNTDRNVWFDLVNGVVSSEDTGANGDIIALENGWYRCSMAIGIGAGVTDPRVRFIMADSLNGGSYLGDGSSGIYLWGAQLTTGSVNLIDYVKTTSTALDSDTGSITIQRTGDSGTGLTAATTGSEVITTHSGDYVQNLEVDTGLVDYRKVIYGFSDPWGSPTIWLGKETEENIATLNLPNPYVKIFDNIVLARFWKFEIEDSTNTDGFISIDDLHISSAFIPSTGISFGAVMGINSNSTSEESAGGVEAFDRENSGRYVEMEIGGLSVDEALTNVFDMQRKLDIDEDFYFVFDSDDTILSTRRSFVARFEQFNGQRFTHFDWVDSQFKIKEKLA